MPICAENLLYGRERHVLSWLVAADGDLPAMRLPQWVMGTIPASTCDRPGAVHMAVGFPCLLQPWPHWPARSLEEWEQDKKGRHRDVRGLGNMSEQPGPRCPGIAPTFDICHVLFITCSPGSSGAVLLIFRAGQPDKTLFLPPHHPCHPIPMAWFRGRKAVQARCAPNQPSRPSHAPGQASSWCKQG